jgi:hypothetical protein
MTDPLHAGDCIRTYSGLYVNVFDPDPETICIEDIAHALSNLCRFAGHTKRFYSVAQHSVLCSRCVDDKFRLQALLHDASEAYLLDIPRPIKIHLVGYKEMENRMMSLIAAKFGFTFPLEKEVKAIDQEMLEMEWKQVVIKDSGFLSWNPEFAKDLFLETFNDLTKEVGNG